MKTHTIVMGVIGEDCHSVGNKVLHVAFKNRGFTVLNLGVQCSQSELINAAKQERADAIIISSLYGHAELDCRGFHSNCLKNGLDNILLYIGGNLSIGKSDWKEVNKKFRRLGFHRVFSPSDDIELAISEIYQDISQQKTLDKKNSMETLNANQKRKVD
ncbi:methylaspartate mutase subunit S [Peribacillus simplex]|uniref:methylaspartate mutase subunit S n=1 Tax=Peribacillus simplex TaxID=1478 RepID=UPI003D2D3DAB